MSSTVSTKAETSVQKHEEAGSKAEFSLDASESELLEEFGVLLAAEYNYQAP
jgi:hypothetical protein